MPSRMVLIEHTLTDGSMHYDWMLHHPPENGSAAPDHGLADPGDNDKVLLTFRVLERIDKDKVQTFTGDMLEPHRYKYLRFEGPVSGKRGSVRRVASGMVRTINILPGGADIAIRARFQQGHECYFAGTKQRDFWHFTRSKPLIVKSPKREADPGDAELGGGGWYRPGPEILM